jgi:AbrB family looped-hinge helix DNA binding protein
MVAETTIDQAGRVVVPKALREALGLTGGARLTIEERDGELVISRVGGGSEVIERDGRLVLVAPDDTAPLTAEQVRELVERGRR